MRQSKWDGVLGTDERIVQHDSTNINMAFKPTLASIQKLTYNQYYSGNCAKVDVVLQPGGFVRVNHLWVGAISDTQYMIANRIFEEQEDFQKKDLVNGTELPFINILDRGYKLTREAMKCGKQTIRQPVFKDKKKRRFTGFETLKSASCASVRSGNERAVRKLKLAGFLRKGLRTKECPRRLDDVAMAWGFMLNFMYNSNA